MPDTFAATLAALRRGRDLSQYDLARVADYDHSYISRLESGDRDPLRDTVDALAAALALTPAERVVLHVAAGFIPAELDHDDVADALWALMDANHDAPTAQNNGPPRNERTPSRIFGHDDRPTCVRVREPATNLDITHTGPLMIGGVVAGEDSP